MQDLTVAQCAWAFRKIDKINGLETNNFFASDFPFAIDVAELRLEELHLVGKDATIV